MTISGSRNIDPHTVKGFGEEWSAFDQRGLDRQEHGDIFAAYFSIFPFDSLPAQAEGFDLGCGSGRWAEPVARRVGLLHCVDPSAKALAVAERRLEGQGNVRFHLASSDTMPLADNSQDFGYSLGVLHHIPDTAKAMCDAVAKLRPGAPFLVYLYYRFDQRPAWFRALWKLTDIARLGVSRLPFQPRKVVTTVIAGAIYWPLARLARASERAGLTTDHWPLSFYRNSSFYTMRTDALDRFGTRLEQRFTKAEIDRIMRDAGLKDVTFRADEPFWVACGYKA